MIWSVSTFERRSGTPMPVWVVNFSMALPSLPSLRQCRFERVRVLEVVRAGQGAAHRGGRRDERRHEVGAAALALATFKVAVGRRRAALLRSELVGVHAQ